MKRMLWAAVLAMTACAPAERPAQKEWRGAFVMVRGENGSPVDAIDMRWLESSLYRSHLIGPNAGRMVIVVESIEGTCGDYAGRFRVVGKMIRRNGTVEIAGDGKATRVYGLKDVSVCELGRSDAIRRAVVDASR